jgi:hypothetical protein
VLTDEEFAGESQDPGHLGPGCPGPREPGRGVHEAGGVYDEIVVDPATAPGRRSWMVCGAPTSRRPRRARRLLRHRAARRRADGAGISGRRHRRVRRDARPRPRSWARRAARADDPPELASPASSTLRSARTTA